MTKAADKKETTSGTVSAMVDGRKFEAPSLEELIAQVDTQIANAKTAEAQLAEEFLKKRTEIRGLVKRLEASKRGLRKNPRTPKRSRGQLDPHKQAGPRNLARVRTAAAAVKEASQAELSAASGVGTGSMTWAIRALVKDGDLVETGERRDGSKVFRYAAKQRKASGRSRTVAPGDAG